MQGRTKGETRCVLINKPKKTGARTTYSTCPFYDAQSQTKKQGKEREKEKEKEIEARSLHTVTVLDINIVIHNQISRKPIAVGCDKKRPVYRTIWRTLLWCG